MSPVNLKRALTMGALVVPAMVGFLATPVSAKVGVVSAVNPAAQSAAPRAQLRVISIGKTVVSNEVIKTDAAGLVQVLLLDGTTFTVGPNSQLVIDKFVYNPDKGTAEVATTLAKGAFRFVGGLASKKKGGATVRMASGTIGIRGAMVEVADGGPGGNSIVSMIFGKEVVYESNGGKRVRLYESGYTLEIGGDTGGGDTNVRRRTASDAKTFQTALAGARGKRGGASRQPTNDVVSQSGFSQVNSNAPIGVTTPTPRPNPVQSSEIEDVEREVAQLDQAAQDIVRDEAVEVVELTNPVDPVDPVGLVTV